MHAYQRDKECKNGIAFTASCADNIKYPVPGSGAPAFYTTWSFYYIFIALGLLLLYCIMLIAAKASSRLNSLMTNKTLTIIVTSLIAMGAVNTVGVYSTSQLLLKNNFKLINTDGQAVPDNIGFQPSFFHKIIDINYTAHLVPMLIAVFILVILCTTQRAASVADQTKLFVSIFVLQLLFVFIWMAVPIKTGDTKVTFINKINAVYNNPPKNVFGIQLVVVVLLILLVSFARNM